jgi:type I restriction enzyme S subunit
LSRWDIPEQWEWVEAGHVAEIVSGGTPTASDPANFADDGFPWLTPADLSGFAGEFVSRGARSLSAQGLKHSSARMLPTGAVLFTSRAPIGYCVIAANPISTNQGFKSLVLKGGVDPRYIRHYLLSAKEYAESLASGSTFKELSGARIAELELPLAPLNEQRRIVRRIDELQARTRAVRGALEAVPPLLEHFGESVLSAAFRGDLTADWRAQNPDVEPASARLNHISDERRLRWETAELNRMGVAGKEPKDARWRDRYETPEGADHVALPRLPLGWVWASLDELIDGTRKISYGVLKPGPHVPDGVRFIKSGQVRDGYLDLSDDFRISTDIDAQYWRTRLRGGEVLLNLVGASIGRSAVAPAELAGANVTRAIAVIPAIDNLAEWIQLALQGPLGQRLVHSTVGGSAQPVLNLSDVRRLAIPLPPIEERGRILLIVQASLRRLAALETTVGSALEKLAILEQSIVRKAFRGELVPQDPSDEPAAGLLRRMQAKRVTKTTRSEAVSRKTPSKTSSDRKALANVVSEQTVPTAPETLFIDSGRDQYRIEDVESFFVELRELVQKREVEEWRPDSTTVQLRGTR